MINQVALFLDFSRPKLTQDYSDYPLLDRSIFIDLCSERMTFMATILHIIDTLSNFSGDSYTI